MKIKLITLVVLLLAFLSHAQHFENKMLLYEVKIKNNNGKDIKQKDINGEIKVDEENNIITLNIEEEGFDYPTKYYILNKEIKELKKDFKYDILFKVKDQDGTILFIQIARILQKKYGSMAIIYNNLYFQYHFKQELTQEEKFHTITKEFIPKKELVHWVTQGNNLQKTKEAAQRGEAYAQRRLARINGFVYKKGKEALYWRKKAANNGDAIAQSNLGFDYQNGLNGLKKNLVEAVKWYRKSALQGNKLGQYNLGVAFEEGNGVKKDLYVAEVWYTKSAKQGYASAQNKLGYFYENGYGGVIKSYKEAVNWYTKAANQGHSSAQNNLGEMYYFGKGVGVNYNKAMFWYRKAAAQNHASSQYSLGYMYEHGEGVVKDLNKAIKLYIKANKQGSSNAKKRLKDLGLIE